LCFSSICSAELFTNISTIVATRHFQNGGVALKKRDATVMVADKMKTILLTKTKRSATAAPESFFPIAMPQPKQTVSPLLMLELHARHRSISLAQSNLLLESLPSGLYLRATPLESQDGKPEPARESHENPSFRAETLAADSEAGRRARSHGRHPERDALRKDGLKVGDLTDGVTNI